MGLGLGLVTVGFTILNAFVFRVHDVRNPHELIAFYSARHTVIGSTRVARQTGTSAARPATVPSRHVEVVSDIQSSGVTP